MASIRFVAGEPEQACRDADLALTIAEGQSSSMIKTRLDELLADPAPYKDLPEVAELQGRMLPPRTGDQAMRSRSVA